MKKCTYLFVGLGGLSFIVLFHELGHFLIATLFGLKIPIFSIGFGPALLQKTIGKTTFQIAVLPLGGYVLLDPKELAMKPYFIKFFIAIGGIVFNVLLAYIIFVGMLLQGLFQTTTTIDHVMQDSPAERHGLQANDTIMSCNDKIINSTAASFSYLAQTIAENPGKSFVIKIIRNNEIIPFTITLDSQHPLLGKNIGWLGITWKQKKISNVSLIDSLIGGYNMLLTTLRNIATLTSELLQQGKKNSITGPIGIMNAMVKSFEFGTYYYAMSIALISLNIGIFNVLPLPFLDGGRILQFTLEALFGPLSTITIVSISLFLFLILLQTIGFFLRKKNKK